MAQAIRTPRLSERPLAATRHITRSDLRLHPRSFRGRHHAATIFVLTLVAVVGYRVFPEREVTVLSNGQAYRVSATFDAETEGLAAASVSLGPGDRLISGSGGKYKSFAIQRAHPIVVEVDGRTLEMKTRASTIAGALAEAGVSLNDSDRVYLDGRLATRQVSLAGVSFASTRAPGASLDVAGSLPDGTVRISVARARPVTVWVDTLPVTTNSAAGTVQALLEDLGMTVREGDLVRPGLSTPLTAGLVVRLAKAQTINVKLDGKDQALYTQARTVADVLRILGLNPGPDEILSPPRETPVTNGMAITIGLTRIVEEEVRDTIAPRPIYEVDASLPAGTVKIVPGVDGLRVSRYRVTYKNGVPQGTPELIESVVVQQPVYARHIEGGKLSSGARPTLVTPEFTGSYTRRITVQSTWYNASHGGRALGDPNYGRTATGVFVDYGICAVDPNFIALGTRFYIEGYGTCIAADTGGGVKGPHVDIGFPEAVGDPGWGAPIIDIYILD